MGYYKIKQSIVQQNLSKYYNFKSDDTICEYLNRFINTFTERKKGRNVGKISMVRPSDERKIYDRQRNIR